MASVSAGLSASQSKSRKGNSPSPTFEEATCEFSGSAALTIPIVSSLLHSPTSTEVTESSVDDYGIRSMKREMLTSLNDTL